MTEPMVEVEARGIVKANKNGKLRLMPERQQALVEEFERSAMTGRQFADWAGVPYSTFGNWHVIGLRCA